MMASDHEIESKITWSLPFREDDLTPDEAIRANAAICEFSDSAVTFEWFKAHGYTLYRRRSELANEWDAFPRCFHPILSSGRSAQAEYPFSHISSYSEVEEKLHTSFGKIWFAQDAQGRHVALNLVEADSDEFRVYELIRKQTHETLRDVCLLPVLDILASPRYCFMVMPRWGYSILRPYPQTIKEVLEILHSMLKALNFLHSHNIVHRDVDPKNMLVNHFNSGRGIDTMRSSLRSAGQLTYALIDFDMAVVFPPDTDRASCLLPSDMSFEGTWPHPEDAAAGEPNYNPFAYDVGCLGIRFCTMIQGYTSQLPFLAPLLDMMTSRNASRRFTAREALDFFEVHVKDISSETLSEYYEPEQPSYFGPYDRWSAIPPEIAERWAAYRQPRIDKPPAAIVDSGSQSDDTGNFSDAPEATTSSSQLHALYNV